MKNRIRLIIAHTKWMVLELVRQPTYVVSTIAFPSLFYMIFAVPESKTEGGANFLVASFCGFALFGGVFLQFGVGLAQERTRSWYLFLKTLPIRAADIMIARFFTAMTFSLMSVLTILLLAKVLTPFHFANAIWWNFAGVLFIGGILFCLMGIVLGFVASEKSALPLGNLVYLPLSFLGGLWKPPEILPESLQNISKVLPTRYFGNMLWAAVKQEKAENATYLGFTIYVIIFLSASVLLARFERSQRFRA